MVDPPFFLPVLLSYYKSLHLSGIFIVEKTFTWDEADNLILTYQENYLLRKHKIFTDLQKCQFYLLSGTTGKSSYSWLSLCYQLVGYHCVISWLVITVLSVGCLLIHVDRILLPSFLNIHCKFNRNFYSDLTRHILILWWPSWRHIHLLFQREQFKMHLSFPVLVCGNESNSKTHKEGSKIFDMAALKKLIKVRISTLWAEA